ncbi:bifunctional 3,4-dihydroxy-2-butanone-4-phosphate synthase/GTP cyclohydrolase II [Clostridiaceae bacterium M8S5]|nr:bifunctional 3,4-dihydroxy-2-butanone-4-phosphate synthase/GTP cyclohydrolase II [Clostridiaceae bacterium M8S5]
MTEFSTIQEAISDLKKGKMVVVVDDENRENEGDLVVLAEHATPEIINFMATHARGLICMPMNEERLEELRLNQMVVKNTDNHSTAFTVSIDCADSTTGISAYERSNTVKKAIDVNSSHKDFKMPGHIFPLRARPSGVLEREGHTEATVDLAKMCGSYPAGVICEIMNEDGTMARLDDLKEFCKKYHLKLISVESIKKHRIKTECILERQSSAKMPTKYGEFEIIGYIDKLTGKEHIVLKKGDLSKIREPLVRIHSECMTGDVFSSLRCDCGNQLEYAMKRINEQGAGIIIYLRQEGRGIGLINKIKAYNLQDKGLDTVDANIALGFEEDERNYYMAAQILKDMDVDKVELLTNNPQKIQGLKEYGIETVDRKPIEIKTNKYNESYLKTKKIRMNHLLSEV